MQPTETQNEPVQAASGALALRGTGKGLWGDDPNQTIAALRNEWDARADLPNHQNLLDEQSIRTSIDS